MEINLFTAALRGEFIKAMQAVQRPAPYEPFTTIIPSTARIENYPWMTPGPGPSRYMGRRRKAQVDQIKYSVENVEYDATLSVPLRDIEDDQIGGYKMRMNEMTVKSGKPFESKLVLTALANGSSGTCFDGSNYFATTHNLGGYPATAPSSAFGGSGNALTMTATGSSDAVVHRFILMVHDDQTPLKPLILQKRKSPEFRTDAGSPASFKAKEADYWIDFELAAAYGYWWNSVQVVITNTPSLTEVFSIIDACRQQIRQFSLPRALPTDPIEYAHEQTQFSPATATIACSVGLEQLLNHALNEDRVGVSVAGSTGGITSNIYYRGFNLVTSNLLNP